MTTRFERLLVALMLAAALAMARFLAASAQSATPPSPTPDCASCHAEQNLHWQNSAHDQASAAFLSAWQEQGSPSACIVCHFSGVDAEKASWQAEEISCSECHSPAPANHPTENMPVNKSSELCGRCHTNTAFSQGQWQTSTHYQKTMTCSACHDPHTTGPRLAQAANGDISALCLNCHQNFMQDFPASAHAAAGISCADCHLGQTPASDGTFVSAHNAPDHDFLPSVQTCAKCHANQMHAPGSASGGSAKTADVVRQQPAAAPVSETPAPVSPLGFAAMAALLGLAGGMVIAPWLERLYQRAVHGGKQ
ncbi:MAG: hypothetical protein OHK0031_04340 [Anaerolineales bacterium]